MRFLCVNQPARANIFGHEFDLKPQKPPELAAENILVADNGTASELLLKHQSVLLEASFNTSFLPGFPIKPETMDQIKPGAQVLILRAGGVGDHVMFLPALAAFRHFLPSDITVWLATQKEKHLIFYLHPAIDRLLPLPLGLDKLLEADFVIDFSDPLDDDNLNFLNMTDYYMKVLGLNEKINIDKRPSIRINPKSGEKIRAAMNELRNKIPAKPLVVIQWKSSNSLRDLPPEMLLFLADAFPDIIFVTPDKLNTKGDKSKLLGKYKNRIIDASPFIGSLEDYIALFETCDGAVSTDTAAYHLAEAFGKPSLALFGPITSGLRIRYYKKTHAISADYTGRTCKAPCGLHKTKYGCPESKILKTPYSPCLLAIDQRTIHEAFKKMSVEL